MNELVFFIHGVLQGFAVGAVSMNIVLDGPWWLNLVTISISVAVLFDQRRRLARDERMRRAELEQIRILESWLAEGADHR